jgi:hypothetical protein
VGDGARTFAFSFGFQQPLDTWARWFAIVPTRSYVRVDDHGFEAVYGLWRVATVWENVVGVERTGPYRAWKVAGPARLSWADRGITLAATTAGGACLRFREPVAGIEPLGVIRHPAVTLGVEGLDRFISMVEERLEAVGSTAASAPPPAHRQGSLLATARAVWSWNRRRVIHEQQTVERVDVPLLDRAGDADDQPVEIGVGPTFHRTYRTVVRGGALRAEEAMAAIQADPNVLADVELAPFTKVRGESPGMRVGDRYMIDVAGPWKGAVEVIDVNPLSFRLATLEGHMESGLIEMRTSDDALTGEQPGVTFTIESWARSHDRFLHVMYDKLGIAKALQGEMWSIACDRFAQLVDGQHAGPLDVTTERSNRRSDSPAP